MILQGRIMRRVLQLIYIASVV